MVLFRILSFVWPITIKKITTSRGQKLFVVYEFGTKVLNSVNANYSYGSLHRAFTFILKHFFQGNPQPHNTLVLGLGAGSIVSILRVTHKINTPITAIELENEIIELANDEFELKKFKQVYTINADAYEWMYQNNRQRFDLILDDMFMDSDLPKDAYSSENLNAIKSHLTTEGVYIRNCIFKNEEERLTMHQKLSEIFDTVSHVIFEEINHFFICNFRKHKGEHI